MSRTVLPGVVRVFFPVAGVNAFVVNADVLTLIDTGTPGAAGLMRRALGRLGRTPRDVGRIIVTHRHADHAGNAGHLAGESGAEVHVAPEDAPFLTQRREQPRPRAATPLGQAMVPYVSVALPWEVEPFEATADLAEGTRIGPFRVIGTPGHTPGHVSLLWEERSILFTADAAAHLTAVGPHPAADDPAMAADSFLRLARMDFDSACFGHGRTIASGAAERFRAVGRT